MINNNQINSQPVSYNPTSYVSYDEIPEITGFQSPDQLLNFIKSKFEDKDWKNKMMAINYLRQINKFYPEEMAKLCYMFKDYIFSQFKSPKTVLNKTTLIFIQEICFKCKHALGDEFIFQLEPYLSKMAFSNKNIIKTEAQQAFNLMISNCISNGLIMSLCQSSANLNSKIAELTLKALQFVLNKIEDHLFQISEKAFTFIFIALANGLKGKRQKLLKISKELTKMIFNKIGRDNFVNFIVKLVQEQQIENKSMKDFEGVFQEEKVTQKHSSKDFRKILKKTRKMSKNLQVNPNFVNTQNIPPQGNIYF